MQPELFVKARSLFLIISIYYQKLLIDFVCEINNSFMKNQNKYLQF